MARTLRNLWGGKVKETLAKLQSLYDLTPGGKWSYEEKFTFNTHTSKKEIKGGIEKARMRVAVLTKSADGRFLTELYNAWPDILKELQK